MWELHIANRAKSAKNINRLQHSPSSCQCLGPSCELCYIYTPINEIFLYIPPFIKKIGPPTGNGPRPPHPWPMPRADHG